MYGRFFEIYRMVFLGQFFKTFYIVWLFLDNLKTFYIVQLSLDIFKNNSKNYYLIFKSNYLTFFPYSSTYMKKKKLTCVFSCSSYFLLIQIKYDIDINNDELMKKI